MRGSAQTRCVPPVLRKSLTSGECYRFHLCLHTQTHSASFRRKFMFKTFSLRPLSIRYALSLLVLPFLLWTGMLTGMHGQAHASFGGGQGNGSPTPTKQGITFSVFATDPVPQASFEVIFPGAVPATVCQSFTPNRWSPASTSNVKNITRIDFLFLFPTSTNCHPKDGEKSFRTGLNLDALQLLGQKCTFDYRNNTLSGCVKPIQRPTNGISF